VYSNGDPRNYELSSYSYFILPTKEGGQFNAGKGRTLAEFTYYAMCQAQQQSASLGYSPLPVNLVTASFDQIAKIPGAEVQNINVQSCNNPTFSPSGENLLAANAPQPQQCDKQGATQCATGTGGLQAVETPTAAPAGGGATSGAATGGGATTGGGTSTGGGATTGGGSASGATTTGGAATGTATDGTGAVDTGTGAPTDTTCDPDTGICSGAASQQSAAGGVVQSGGQQVGGIVPSTLEQDSGLGSQETLMLIVALLTLGLVFVPAYYWRKLSTPDPTPSGAPMPAPERQQVSV
jgi:phosphate transport system substrate-binding protein